MSTQKKKSSISKVSQTLCIRCCGVIEVFIFEWLDGCMEGDRKEGRMGGGERGRGRQCEGGREVGTDK